MKMKDQVPGDEAAIGAVDLLKIIGAKEVEITGMRRRIMSLASENQRLINEIHQLKTSQSKGASKK